MAVPSELGAAHERQVVVVVEDDPGYLRALVKTLERDASEVEVIEAATGVDGLLEIGRVSPDLGVLDYELPDLNEVQVVERLIDATTGLTPPVTIVTDGLRATDMNDLTRLEM